MKEYNKTANDENVQRIIYIMKPTFYHTFKKSHNVLTT